MKTTDPHAIVGSIIASDSIIRSLKTVYRTTTFIKTLMDQFYEYLFENAFPSQPHTCTNNNHLVSFCREVQLLKVALLDLLGSEH
jgi:hypothetical protein